MKGFLRLSSIVVIGGCLFAAALAALDGNRVRVESRDGRYNAVRVRTEDRVRIVRRLSDAPCREGRSWGYDANRIWVDDGCRADFEFGRDYRDGRYDRNDDWRWDNRRDDRRDDDWRRDDRWDRDGRYGNNRTIRLRVESKDGRREYRNIPVSGEVRLVRRLSDAPCRLGRSWGYSSNGIWVDDGCRADFEVRVR